MPRPPSQTLTDAEGRIMAVLWERGEASVREITQALEPDFGLAYSSVLTTIRIMTKKGYVGFRKEARAHIYRPLMTRDGAQKKALGSVMASLFDNSPQRLAQHLVENDELSLDDIEALKARLLAAKGKDKS